MNAIVLFFAVLLHFSFVQALESPPLGALTRFEYVTETSVETLPHVLYKRSLDVNTNVATIDDQFRISFRAFQQTFYVHLEPTPHLLHSEAQLVLNSNWTSNIRDTLDIGLYKGRVLSEEQSSNIFEYGDKSDFFAPSNPMNGRDQFESTREDLGWARITVFDASHHADIEDLSFEGVLTLNGELYTIQSVKKYHTQSRDFDAHTSTNDRHKSQIVIYRESDRVPTVQQNATVSSLADVGEHKCASESLPYNQDTTMDILRKMHTSGGLNKRALAGCPTAIKIVYMGIAGDCTYVSNYGGSDGALKQILSDWNQASRLYETTFNIALGIIKVNLQSSCTVDISWNRVCSDGYLINQRLSDFSQWRGTQSADAGLWHLMTQCSSGATVGISWLNSVCTTNVVASGGNQYVSGCGVSSVHANEWMIVAHEIGHNFGAVHDCTAGTCGGCPGAQCQCCPCTDQCDCQGEYLMNPTSDVKLAQFSPCTQALICARSTSASCLSDPGSKTTITGNQCGNGVKEPGEDCDCGPADGPDCAADKCCTPATCKFKNGATCDDFNDGCCTGCQPKSSGAVCRPGRSTCDIVESCDGTSGSCPPDKFQPDLSSCKTTDGSTAQCASGDCTSRDIQCKLRGGLIGVNSECPGYSNQCGIYCQGTQIGQCVQVSGFYEDGSPCGYSGLCANGVCNQDGLSAALGWAQAHLGIVILIGVVVGFFILICVGRALQVCLHNRKFDQTGAGSRNSLQRDPNHQMRDQNNPAAMAMADSYGMQQRSGSRVSAPNSWVSANTYNGDLGGVDDMDAQTLAAIQASLADQRPTAPPQHYGYPGNGPPPVPPKVNNS